MEPVWTFVHLLVIIRPISIRYDIDLTTQNTKRERLYPRCLDYIVKCTFGAQHSRLSSATSTVVGFGC